MDIRNKSTYTLTDPTVFYHKMLNWLNQFNIFCLLKSDHVSNLYNSYDVLVGIDAIEIFSANENVLSILDAIAQKKDWLFGHISYDLKNEIEDLSSTKNKSIDFETISFFRPKIVLYFNASQLTIESIGVQNDSIIEAIENYTISPTKETPISIQQKVNKENYIATINAIKKHIHRGDCYELNYCMEFFAENCALTPQSIFQKLNTISPNPFTAFYKTNNQYLICASPERFLRKEGTTLISQPIKGTIKRDIANPIEDAQLKESLWHSPKEKSENIMVVDLVRNDLSKICMPNSVTVAELIKVYSFPQVHHLISTVTGTIKPDINFATIIKATFPMGSMTGAPKKRVMELIEKYEASYRGVFSGTVGYIAPNGNFDFNVVIRSIMYNANTNYLSYMVGSGITNYCEADKEYEECLLKAKAIEQVLR